MTKKNMGLKAFAGVVQSATQRGDSNVPLHLIDIEPQVRTQFDPEKQASINASIKAQGRINQSVVLLAKPDGRYRLIAGEYRIRGAYANEFQEVPARIMHNLSDREIRRIQVSENMERTDISAFDEAMGVAQDVEKFGFDGATEIWNRSEGWVSKRTAVLKYADKVRALLKDGVCNDLEVAHSLNQIQQLDDQEYNRLEKRLRDGFPLSRDEARGKVQQVKEWQKETKQREERRQTLAANASPAKRQAEAIPTRKTASKQQSPVSAAARDTTASRATEAPSAPASSEDVPPSAAVIQPATDPEAVQAADDLSKEQAVVLHQMVTLFENGRTNYGLMQDVQNELAALGADMNQTEFAMWSLYQTVVLPMLAALGETRAQRYLQRTVAELRGATPQELWSQLHPTTDGNTSADWSAPRAPVAPMPKDWRF